MKDRLVWLIKNSRIYKRTLKLLLALRKELTLRISPGSLFLMQHDNGNFNRYDVVVRLMAIEEIEGKSAGGLDLYHKMQQKRYEYLTLINKKIKPEDFYQNKGGVIQGLVESYKSDGFDARFPISVNSRLKLVDGSHRLACALYFQKGDIVIEKGETANIDYGLSWFRENFEPHDVDLIETRYQHLLKTIDIKAVLKEFLLGEKQVFGRGQYYQSFEEIGIPGQRPTAERYRIYNLDEQLAPNNRALDIGCNCGFFAIMIAGKVKEVVGIEINQTLVDIAQVLQVYLNRTNITFKQGNFNKIKFSQKFDFICSFAVHHWLGVDMRKYGNRLYELLNPGGKVLLESQNIHQQDVDWEYKLAKFKQAGFDEIDSGHLKDDGVIERRFSVLQRN